MESINKAVGEDIIYSSAAELRRYFNLFIGRSSNLGDRREPVMASLERYKAFKSHKDYNPLLVSSVEIYILNSN